MSAAARNKGIRYQRFIRGWFAENGFDPLARPGGEDGDDLRLLGMPWFSIELKGQSRMRLAEWFNQATEQAGDKIPILIWKRTGKAQAADQWVQMDLQGFTRLLRLLQQHRDANDVLARALSGSFEGSLQRSIGHPELDGLVAGGEEPKI